MKKILSLLLAVLLSLSCFTAFAFAAEPTVDDTTTEPAQGFTITFDLSNCDAPAQTIITTVQAGELIPIPTSPTMANQENRPMYDGKGNEIKDSEYTAQFIFQGYSTTPWDTTLNKGEELSASATVILPSELAKMTAEADTTYYPQFIIKEIVEEDSFWDFVKSIFDRITMIFNQLWAYVESAFAFLPEN